MDGFTLLNEVDPAVEAVHPPRMLGRYELLGKLGDGGMATVYLARTAGEAGFQRMFAIKVLHPHLASDTGFVTMLLDEARIAARLHHPNVVPIIDLGAENGVYYVAMEYIEGCSLSALLKKRRDERPARLLIAIMVDVLAGLDSAHSLTDDDGRSMNLVHRDVSPQNILIGIDGSARIIDFGIARAESRITSTRPGQMKGKIAYMSPEQISNGQIDRRSDVFAAGAVLWSMLTGRRLFQGDNAAATMGNIMSMEIPLPSTIGLRPPPMLDAICLCALQRTPGKRFATAREMEEALRQSAEQEGMLATHREVAAWVADVFSEELAARRNAIRSASQGHAPARAVTLPGSVPPGSLMGSSEFSKVTPVGTTRASDAKTVLAVPVDANQAAGSRELPPIGLAYPGGPYLENPDAASAGSGLRRTVIVGGSVAIVVLSVVAWLAMRSGHHRDPDATASPPAESVAPPTRMQTVPPAEPVAAPSPTPTTKPEEPATKVEVAPIQPTIQPPEPTPAPPPPEPARHKPSPVRVAPTRTPAKPTPTPPPPTPTTTTTTTPTTTTTTTTTTPTTKPAPTKPTTWDKDSPLPPP